MSNQWHPEGGRGGIPSDVLTSSEVGVRRVAVDSQQTSFEQNTQFRYHDEIEEVSSGDTIVYRVSMVNSINIFSRTTELFEGGRRLRIYSALDDVIFSGTLLDSGRLTFINSALNDRIDSHPVSGVTFERAIGSGIFDANEVAPITGQAILVSGTGNKADSAYSPNEIRIGIAAGSSFWVVLEHIGGNSDTSGSIEFVWEERY